MCRHSVVENAHNVFGCNLVNIGINDTPAEKSLAVAIVSAFLLVFVVVLVFCHCQHP